MTQAQEELQELLEKAEEYRIRNGMDSLMISVVGGGKGHAYAYKGVSRVDAAVGAWETR